MKNEFVLAFNEVLEEKGLPRETILEALASAMVSAYRKSVTASSAQEIRAQINLEKGEFLIIAEKEVVKKVVNSLTEVELEKARAEVPEAQIGDIVMVESTPANFGRVAAQTARQVIQQKIREAEHSAQYERYEKQLGEIISGVVQAASSKGLTIGLELNAEGTMPRKEMISREHFRIHERIRALVTEVKETSRGPQIILSRTHRDFLRRLLENEVPEIYHGVVEIRSIAREPGHRAKVAVSAAQQGIDPVGACVGMRGVRIQAIVRELNDEKIDVIEWNPDPKFFISKAISPARVTGVYPYESREGAKNALVVVPDDQLSLAIGRDGQNARLAAKLTGWRIDIKGLTESVSDWLFALKNNEKLKDLGKNEKEAIEQAETIMARKVEGRQLSNSDNDFLAVFNDRLETIISKQRQAERDAYKEAKQDALDEIPQGAFKLDLEVSELPANIIEGLQQAGIRNAGDLVLTSRLNEEKILDVSGIGPKTLEKILEFGEQLPALVPEEEPEEAIQEPSATEETAEEEAQLDAVDVEESELEQPEAQPDEEAEPSEQALVEQEPPQDEQIEESRPEKADEKEKPKKVEKVKSFEDLFKLDLESIQPDDFEDEKFDDDKDAKKKSKSKKSRRIEYDPDLDMTYAKKKHKREDGEWEEW